jgi:hypothetical protein
VREILFEKRVEQLEDNLENLKELEDVLNTAKDGESDHVEDQINVILLLDSTGEQIQYSLTQAYGQVN